MSAGVYAEESVKTLATYRDAAQKLIDENNYPAAIEILQTANQQYPDEQYISNLIGVLHIEMDQFAAAEEVLGELIRVAPEFAGAHFNYGELYFRKKEYAQAREYFQQSLELRGEDESGVIPFKLFLCDLLSGQPISANDPYLTASPSVNHPLAYYARAAMKFNAGDQDKAREWLQSAYSIYPMRKNLVYLHSMVTLGWVTEGEFDELQAAYRKKLQAGRTAQVAEEITESDSEVKSEVESEEDEAKRMQELESLLPQLD
ncbi:MAG: tetratricopeptide repeat protein [Verrucomicrobiota bacterium]